MRTKRTDKKYFMDWVCLICFTINPYYKKNRKRDEPQTVCRKCGSKKPIKVG